MNKTGTIFCLILFLTACATTPELNLENVNKEVTVNDVLSDSANYVGTKVLWSGIIVKSENLQQGTLLEVLAYPNSSRYKPEIDEQPIGRFLAQYPQYLETMNYSPGRLITVTGPVTEIRQAQIGEAQYTYPVVQPDELYLWPRDETRSRTGFSFGIGVLFSN